MKLFLHRVELHEKATLGQLFIDDAPECVTLEDIVRPAGEAKVMHETAIPAGTYDITIRFSQRFQKLMIAVQDVPGFTGILIHSGNTDANTSGCILVGKVILNSDYISGGSIALPLLQAKIRYALDSGEKVSLTITDDFKTEG